MPPTPQWVSRNTCQPVLSNLVLSSLSTWSTLPLQYAHKSCVQRWLNERPEKGSVTCEVCSTPLRGNWQLWRAADDPLHSHLAALWHLLLHGSGPAELRSTSEEWAAPGLSTERRRVSGSKAAWGLALLLAASGVLFLRQVLRVVPSTGTLQMMGEGGRRADACSRLVHCWAIHVPYRTTRLLSRRPSWIRRLQASGPSMARWHLVQLEQR